jgi:hypothetical protein
VFDKRLNLFFKFFLNNFLMFLNWIDI